MRVLAVDPGFDRMGLAVLEKKNGKEIVLFSSCVVTDRSKEFPERLKEIASAFAQTAEEWRPEAVALEKLYFSKNQKTAIRVAEARGAIESEAARAGIPVRELAPNEIKIAVTGTGNATKNQVGRMVRILVHLLHEPKYDDEIDAIAAGIAFFATSRYPQE